MTDRQTPTMLCGTHGRRVAAVVCGHLVSAADAALGFVENSTDPTDLQAWCDDCERLYTAEGEMTAAFKRFTKMAVVCTECYVRMRERHSRIG